jgi:hypothetical protein
MEFEEVSRFLKISSDKLSSCWEFSDLINIAQTEIPASIMSDRASLLRADAKILWTQWFLESICDPEVFVNSNRCYPHIFKTVSAQVSHLFPRTTVDQQMLLASQISNFIDQEVERRSGRNRPIITIAKKRTEWDLSGPEQRCWVCGYKFTDWAKRRFLEEEEVSFSLPKFVDYIKPIGLLKRDISVELDHVIPFSRGGLEGENLRLACGWCNARKSSKISIYDVDSKPRKFLHPRFGRITVPNGFWIVRLLALRNKCEHPGGCNKTTDIEELTIAPSNLTGALNPTNLRVTCLEHDPLGSSRLVSRNILQKRS